MIATNLWKVTRQPFDSTYDSHPRMLGNSAGILSAVLHYELSFVFLFFPRWIYFLSTSKCRDCSIHQVHGIQRRYYQHVSSILARKTENQKKHSASKQEQMPERSHISRYSINKPLSSKWQHWHLSYTYWNTSPANDDIWLLRTSSERLHWGLGHDEHMTEQW